MLFLHFFHFNQEFDSILQTQYLIEKMNYFNAELYNMNPCFLGFPPMLQPTMNPFNQNNYCQLKPIFIPITENFNSLFCFSKEANLDSTTVPASRESQVQTFNQKSRYKQKNMPAHQKKIQKKDGNTKANIIRDFIRSLKKDATPVLLAKKYLNYEYPIKKFIEILLKNFPQQDKYIRFKKVKQLCTNNEDVEFAHLLRTIFFNFLRNDYQIAIVSKKKNKFEYLKVCRELVQKMNKIQE